MNLTNRSGVDVVLNALAAEAIPMGLACPAGSSAASLKSASATSTRTRASRFGRCAATPRSTWWRWMLCSAATESLTVSCWARSPEESGGKGRLNPLPFRAFPASRVDAAFRCRAGRASTSARWWFPSRMPSSRAQRGPLAEPFDVKAEWQLLITGAFGGFGKVLANWLVKRGARRPTSWPPQRHSTPCGKVCGRLCPRWYHGKGLEDGRGRGPRTSRASSAKHPQGQDPLQGCSTSRWSSMTSRSPSSTANAWPRSS